MTVDTVPFLPTCALTLTLCSTRHCTTLSRPHVAAMCSAVWPSLPSTNRRNLCRIYIIEMDLAYHVYIQFVMIIRHIAARWVVSPMEQQTKVIVTLEQYCQLVFCQLLTLTPSLPSSVPPLLPPSLDPSLVPSLPPPSLPPSLTTCLTFSLRHSLPPSLTLSLPPSISSVFYLFDLSLVCLSLFFLLYLSPSLQCLPLSLSLSLSLSPTLPTDLASSSPSPLDPGRLVLSTSHRLKDKVETRWRQHGHSHPTVPHQVNCSTHLVSFCERKKSIKFNDILTYLCDVSHVNF